MHAIGIFKCVLLTAIAIAGVFHATRAHTHPANTAGIIIVRVIHFATILASIPMPDIF
jgi:hypothetical protein